MPSMLAWAASCARIDLKLLWLWLTILQKQC